MNRAVRQCLLCVLLLGVTLGSGAMAQSETSAAPGHFTDGLQGFELLDQNGERFTPASVQGKTLLFNFIFTHCASICPTQTKVLADVMRALPEPVREQIHFVSVSLEPERDTPAKLKTFANAFDADLPNWHFLTGDAEGIQRFAESLMVVKAPGAETDDSELVHSASLWLVDTRGRVLQRYRGDPPNKERLTRELPQASSLGNTSAVSAR